MTVDPNRVECDYCGTDTRRRQSGGPDSRAVGQLMTGLIFACALLLALAAITDIRAGGLTAWEERDQA